MIKGKWIDWMTDVAGKSIGSYKNWDHVLVKKKAHRSATVLTIKRDRKRREMDGFIWQIRQSMLDLFIFWFQLLVIFWLSVSFYLPARLSAHLKLRYRSGTVNSNTANSKFHLIRSFCEIFARFLSFHV